MIVLQRRWILRFSTRWQRIAPMPTGMMFLRWKFFIISLFRWLVLTLGIFIRASRRTNFLTMLLLRPLLLVAVAGKPSFKIATTRIVGGATSSSAQGRRSQLAGIIVHCAHWYAGGSTAARPTRHPTWFITEAADDSWFLQTSSHSLGLSTRSSYWLAYNLHCGFWYFFSSEMEVTFQMQPLMLNTLWGKFCNTQSKNINFSMNIQLYYKFIVKFCKRSQTDVNLLSIELLQFQCDDVVFTLYSKIIVFYSWSRIELMLSL